MKILHVTINRFNLLISPLKLFRFLLLAFGLLTFCWANLVFFSNTSPQQKSSNNNNWLIFGKNTEINNSLLPDAFYSGTSQNSAIGEIRKLANVIIIGARKCGTRALLEFLNLHPDVATVRQETHFFDQDQVYNRGIEWYMTQMPGGGNFLAIAQSPKIIIEKTPGYFVSPKAPDRIFEFNSSIKLILILRNPITRLISDYTQVHYTKLSKGKRHDILERVVFDEQGHVRACYKPVRNSLYADHVTHWLEKFSPTNLHIVDGDLFIKDPLAELRKLETFLGLGHKITHQHIYFNQTKGFYCYRHPKEGAKCLGETKGRRHVTVSPEAIERLRQFFRPYNEKLFSLIGKTFDW